MLSFLTLGLLEKSINVALSSDALTEQQLMHRLDGKCLRVVSQSPQMSVDMRIDAGKIRLEPTAMGMAAEQTPSVFEQRPYDKQHCVQSADCTLSVTHMIDILRFMQPDFAGSVPVSGDMSVLQQLKHILSHTQLNIATLLQPVVGVSVASQIQRILSHGMQQVQRQASQGVFYGQEWIKEDSAILATRWQMDAFKQSVRAVRTDTERMQHRLDALLAEVAQSYGTDG